MLHLRTKRRKYADLRERLIKETELALFIGLRFPQRVPRIPAIEVGGRSFDPDFAQEFWDSLLGDMSDLFRFVKRNPHVLDLHTHAGASRVHDPRQPVV